MKPRVVVETEKKIADCEAALDVLRERYDNLNENDAHGQVQIANDIVAKLKQLSELKNFLQLITKESQS